MPLRFSVLASGSSGNVSWLEAGGFGVLIDLGLGPRQLAGRLASAGIDWNHVHAALLTHIHSDHWRETTFAQLRRRRIPLFCHSSHAKSLRISSPAFASMQTEQLVQFYPDDRTFELTKLLQCRPISLRHDGGATFGFRFVRMHENGESGASLAYVADLGSWRSPLARALADVDLLALEFNHDVDMERQSGRSPHLIARVLGDNGHLSNRQAAELLREVLKHSSPGRMRHVVQLHLSRDCNRPAKAIESARAVLSEHEHTIELHTASQGCASAMLTVAKAEHKARTMAEHAGEASCGSRNNLQLSLFPDWE